MNKTHILLFVHYVSIGNLVEKDEIVSYIEEIKANIDLQPLFANTKYEVRQLWRPTRESYAKTELLFSGEK
jgi:hypothetical protein